MNVLLYKKLLVKFCSNKITNCVSNVRATVSIGDVCVLKYLESDVMSSLIIAD